MKLMCKQDYENQTASTRDQRMAWWRNARFGMFVHYGLYSVHGKQEWAMALENFPVSEYEKLTQKFKPKENAPREWVELAAKAGMKYVVMTTRHHEGYSLWDSKVNPYNSVRQGPGRDLVREFVDACREYNLKIGLYFSLMDWHHPDSGAAAFDKQARMRFVTYIQDMLRELMTNYGKIDILWYDVALPMKSAEGWNSLEINQMVRELQPDIIINNRSRLDEDFGTPEGAIRAEDRDWEACMTFNDISWGYVDSRQAAPYSYNAQRIAKMLFQVVLDGGNLLLNIGPQPDGSVPPEAVEPLTKLGEWLSVNGEAVYGEIQKNTQDYFSTTRLTYKKGNRVYAWNFIWPDDGEITIGGIQTPLKAARYLGSNQPIDFEQYPNGVKFINLPAESPDCILGITVMELIFEEPVKFTRFCCYPQLNEGKYIENWH